MQSFLTVIGENTASYEEKRSKFIATIRHCETEEEAISFIEEMRAKYWDARHNCFAYSVEGGKLARFSDDGEPHGTAGKPILDVILGNEIKNVAIVVTRYFGGVLLGTGGLVRAYSTSSKEALLSAEIAEMIPCYTFNVTCEYSEHQKLEYLITGQNGHIEKTDFTDKVSVVAIFRECDAEGFLDKLREQFSARIEAVLTEKTVSPFKIEKTF